MIYLDNAATTYPKPESVRSAVYRAMMQFGANPGRGGYALSEKTAELVYRCRKELAEFFDAPGPECVVFTQNCTHGLNLVIKGLLKEGDHAVISSMEHNAVVRPLEKLKEKGVSYSVAQVSANDRDATVDAFRKALRPNTKLVICTHASNVWGIRLPIERIAALCHVYGIPILVDCAQSAGILPVQMQKFGLDYLCAPGHKGLYGPMGTGVMLALRGEELDTLIEGGTGTNSAELSMPNFLPERFESGTLNVPGIAGLLEGVRFLRKMDGAKLYQKEMGQIKMLYQRLKALDFVRLYSPMPDVPVLSFNVKGLTGAETARLLAQSQVAVRGGLHCAPLAHRAMQTEEKGSARVSLSAFTLNRELEQFVRILCTNYEKSQKAVDSG